MNKKHTNNLIDLSIGLLRVSNGTLDAADYPRFDMRHYAKFVDSQGKPVGLPVGYPYNLKKTYDEGECGTCCCAMGHAPLFCDTPPQSFESWGLYCMNLFGLHLSSPEWFWLFSEYWSNERLAFCNRAYTLLMGVDLQEAYDVIDYVDDADVDDEEDVKKKVRALQTTSTKTLTVGMFEELRP